MKDEAAGRETLPLSLRAEPFNGYLFLGVYLGFIFVKFGETS